MFPLEVTFKHVGPSQALKERVYSEAKKLEKISPKIISAKVVISLPHKSHQQGKIFHVNISVNLAGKTLVVTNTPENNHALENAQVAIRNAFRAMEHEISTFVNRRRARNKLASNQNIQL